MSTLLKNGLVYIDGELHEEDLLIAGTKIKAIGFGLEADQPDEIIDLKGKLVSPGLVDIHEHYR